MWGTLVIAIDFGKHQRHFFQSGHKMGDHKADYCRHWWVGEMAFLGGNHQPTELFGISFDSSMPSELHLCSACATAQVT
jgi:hypothetical protein